MNKIKVLHFWVIMPFCVVSMACSPTQIISQNEPISIRLNQKRVNLEKGIRLSQAKTVSKPYLSLEVTDSVLVDNLAKSNNLQIILARGSRSITSFQTEYDIPYRMGFSVDSLFDDAQAGDRLILYADNFILYTLAIR